MRALEAQLLHPLADLGNAHEQLPDETRSVILDHDHDRPLADREVTVGVPVILLAETVDEAVPSPNLVAEIVIEVSKRPHRLCRRVGEARQGRARRDDALVVHGRMRIVALDRVAGRETPAVRPVALEPERVADAVGVIDARVSNVLLPIVRIGVTQPTWIDAAEGIVGEEERSARIRSERKLDPLETATVDELAALNPALMIGFGGHRKGGRGRGGDGSDEG